MTDDRNWEHQMVKEEGNQKIHEQENHDHAGDHSCDVHVDHDGGEDERERGDYELEIDSCPPDLPRQVA